MLNKESEINEIIDALNKMTNDKLTILSEEIIKKIDKQSIQSFDKARIIEIDDDTTIFNDFCGYLESKQSFSFYMIISEIIKEMKLNSKIFTRKTGIDKRIYSKLINNNDYIPDMRTIVSIAIGLQLNTVTTAKLINSAGLAFCDSRYRDRVYNYIVERCKNDDIPGFKDILLKTNDDRIMAYNCILCKLGLEENELIGDKI